MHDVRDYFHFMGPICFTIKSVDELFIAKRILYG